MKKIILFIAVLLYIHRVSGQTSLDSSNLPIVIINTNGQGINQGVKTPSSMRIIYNGSGSFNHVTDVPNNYNNNIGIEVRGQSSTGFDQLQYNIETRDSAQAKKDTIVLGMPTHADWVLYAPYTDKSLMRNVITYQLALDMGHWAARTKFCEVIIDGDYKGVYVFMEKIKRDKNRVNIKKLLPTSNSADSITGGYIFSIDKDQPDFYSTIAPNNATSGQNIGFTFKYPTAANISTPQAEYLKHYVLDSFENTLNSPNFMDPVNGYRKYVSIKSFIDFMLINEVSKNVDGYRLSSYFYKDRYSNGGLLKAGPVWDFNLAWHNADYCAGELSSGWAYKFNDVCGGDNWVIPFWWDKMMTDTVYQNKLYCRWQELRGTLLNTTVLFGKIDSMTLLLNDAQARHFVRYPILGTYVWPNPSPLANTYAEEILATKNWIVDRLAWLDANILPNGTCAPPVVTGIGNSNKINYSNVYPNPFTDKVSVTVTIPTNDVYTTELYSIMGQKLAVLSTINYTSDEYTLVYNLGTANYKAGMYYLKISSSSSSQTIKVVKQ